jgi:hypothetical protein
METNHVDFERREIIDSHHGMLWEVPLEEHLGFAYVQTLSMSAFSQLGTLVKILDYRSEHPFKGKGADFFKNIDFLTSPVLGINPPPQRGEKKWKKLGYLPILEEDLRSPEFKAEYIRDNSINIEKQIWYVFFGISASDTLEEKYTYNQVKHLSSFGFTNLRFMRHRITMEWMKYLDMDYESYTTSDSPAYINLDDQKYFVKCGVHYSEVPREIRGRAIRS